MEILIVFVVVLFVLIGLASSSGERHAERIGNRGELKVVRKLRSKLDPTIYRQFHDLTLPIRNDTTQIDHVVVSPFGVFVIETKNYSGWIFGDRNSRVWTQTFYGGKYKFQNPLRQNFKHTKAIESVLSLPAEYVHSVVVFVGSAEFRTVLPTNVVYLKELLAHILSHKEPIIGPVGVERVTKLLSRYEAGLPDISDQTVHRQVEANEPMCPLCKVRMKKRTVREGAKRGTQFWGCARFPNCRETRPMQ